MEGEKRRRAVYYAECKSLTSRLDWSSSSRLSAIKGETVYRMSERNPSFDPREIESISLPLPSFPRACTGARYTVSPLSSVYGERRWRRRRRRGTHEGIASARSRVERSHRPLRIITSHRAHLHFNTAALHGG